IAVGTGGTITGMARYLKEQNPDVLIVGADPEGSIYTAGPEKQHPYLVEGIGEDFYPQTFDPSVVDRWVTGSDRDSFLIARRLAAGARAAGSRLPQPRRAERGGRGRDAAAARGGRGERVRRRGLRRFERRQRRRPRRVGRQTGGDADSFRPARIPGAWPFELS